ncbi:hypothetical protein E2320_020807 [Naja naja]|nr:hypothetical protein E2320_020807 [Naja naja]
MLALGVQEPVWSRGSRRAQPGAEEQVAGDLRRGPEALGLRFPNRDAAGRFGQATVGRGGRRIRARFLQGNSTGWEVPLPGADGQIDASAWRWGGVP